LHVEYKNIKPIEIGILQWWVQKAGESREGVGMGKGLSMCAKLKIERSKSRCDIEQQGDYR
jgi:hypothetical protein